MRYLLLLTGWLLTGGLGAQPDDYLLRGTLENDSVFFAWYPQDYPAFLNLAAGALSVEVTEVGGSDRRPTFRPLLRQPIVPAPYDSWRGDLRSNWDTIAIVTLHPDRMDAGLRDASYWTDGLDELTTAEMEASRHEIINYAARFDWEVLRRSGLGIAVPTTPGARAYGLKLFPTSTGDTLYFEQRVAGYTQPEVPELTVDFRDGYADLEWRTLEFNETFFAYHPQRSIDGGPFTDIFPDDPLMNPYDTIVGVDESLYSLRHRDFLPANGTTITYRLYGVDYLGRRSQQYREVTGQGMDDITQSPILTNSIQTDSNYAVLQWKFPERQEGLLEEFRIVHTDSQGVNYRLALDGIPPDAREVAVPMAFSANYFRVQAASRAGSVYSSFESLVMSYDIEPPAVPADFDGYIDTLGFAHFSWTTSDEPDLLGYYLFKGYFDNEELVMITPKPLPGPTYVDTVNMEVGNEYVYYQLRSTDTRGNGSAFTAPLKLKKPDVFPPAPPRMTVARGTATGIELRWTRSPSKDAETYRLYRRIEDSGTGFELLISWTADDWRPGYTDNAVEAGRVYVYTLEVTDDDGLVGERSQPVAVELIDYGLEAPIEAFTGRPGARRTALLEWTYAEQPREFYLYRARNDEPLALLRVVDGATRSFTDEPLVAGNSYTYLLRAVFPGGRMSPFTAEVSVIVE